MQGLIFIPDITGFTDFVRKIDIDLGVSITRDLLSEVIDNNNLELELSEIEGDAVLFYKLGLPIPLSEVFNTFNRMHKAFNQKKQALRNKYKIEIDLSLKFILHYGEMNIYYIKGFKKLYGQMIIESHRLLKNGTGYSNYILITDDYMKAIRNSSENIHTNNWNLSSVSSQLFSGLREISYYFFNNSSGEVSPVALSSNNIA